MIINIADKVNERLYIGVDGYRYAFVHATSNGDISYPDFKLEAGDRIICCFPSAVRKIWGTYFTVMGDWSGDTYAHYIEKHRVIAIADSPIHQWEEVVAMFGSAC